MPSSNVFLLTEPKAPEDLKTSSSLFELRPLILPYDLTLRDGTTIRVSPMEISDYEAVRAIIPKVSRCSEIFSPETVAQLLDLPTFFPFVGRLSSGDIIAYAELHRLPHLGRGFDGRLEKVVVVESMRGKKLAQQFCDSLISMAREKLMCGRVDLTVEKPDAKKVYGNLGFNQVDTEVWRLML